MTISANDDRKSGAGPELGRTLEKLYISYSWICGRILEGEAGRAERLCSVSVGNFPVIAPSDDRPPAQSNAIKTCPTTGHGLVPPDRYDRPNRSQSLYWRQYIRNFRDLLAVGIGLCACGVAGQALAWGATGHRFIGRLAVETLPMDLPQFLHTPAAVEAEGELAREPDRWKGSGKIHDADRDAAHFLDLGDDGKVFGGPSLGDLPTTRADYDAALRAVGADSWKAGYLPYAIIDGWQQLTRDFAYWRVDTAAAKGVADPAHRAWFAQDGVRRQALLLRDLGTLAHYVGDGSQPMHVSIHFNGWGDFPNPDGFTKDRIHAPFEGAFVRSYVTQVSVRAAMTPYRECQCGIDARMREYLAATNQMVRPLYQLYKDGAFGKGDARGQAFVVARLAAGASELRDEIIDAWRASATSDVGWPAVKVADVLAGKLDPFDSLYGED